MDIVLKTGQGLSFYVCDAFDPALVAHGFSTRVGGVSPDPWRSLNLGANRGDDPARVAENYRRFCRAIGTDSNATVKNFQVHGTVIRPVTAADRMPDPAAPGVIEADGLITDQPGLCLTVFTTDCIPVLLLDPVRRVIAAVHAGWRGTALGAAAQAARQMQTDYGCRPGDILAAIGPGLDACCFLTHEDVPAALRAQLGREADAWIRPAEGGRFHVDLKGVNAHWLRREGVLEQHIARSDACTGCRPDLFWSHRLLGEPRGSMAAMLQLLDR